MSKDEYDKIKASIERLYQKGYLCKKKVGSETFWKRTKLGDKYFEELKRKKDILEI